MCNSHDDKMHEACGIYGIYHRKPSLDTAGLIYYGLFALQHRGQESAGMSLSLNNAHMVTHKGVGLVQDVFTDHHLKSLQKFPSHTFVQSGIGHVRYATTGSGGIDNAQPHVLMANNEKSIALVHNGNLINIKHWLPSTLHSHNLGSSDTQALLALIASFAHLGMKEAIAKACLMVQGSFALLILADNVLYAVRDPFGVRPLCMGERADGSVVFASESCALEATNANFIRNIDAGELVIVNEKDVQSLYYAPQAKLSPCAFEPIYFARPDSVLDGTSVYQARFEAGQKLYEQNPDIVADLVIGVPDSGLAAAAGFAAASNIAYSWGLVKNRYIGRSFIQPTQELRDKAVELKLSPIRSLIAGKRLVVIDDSLVRGTTSKHLIQLLRKAGAIEIHFKLASPPIMHPCFLGIDIATKGDLIAANKTIEQIRDYIGADSLDFLQLSNLTQLLNQTSPCLGCFNANYPISKPLEY